MKCFMEVNHYLRQYKEVRSPYNFIGWTTVEDSPIPGLCRCHWYQIVYYEVASFPGPLEANSEEERLERSYYEIWSK